MNMVNILRLNLFRNESTEYRVDFLITRADEAFEESTNDDKKEEEEESVEDDEYEDYTYKKLYRWDEEND
ncbi:hypothetical protein M9Y10_038170 [Tritrichomonas musculus]|uniref:Uncharacterized protein n=1 Tax=Tritrichomonas musculus TaxID=1915356 RepID=A0ABR2K9H5_9EUKA